MRVLVVEDEIKLAKQLKIGLEQEGYVVDYKLDGGEGQKYIESNEDILDLILLDITLPTQSGLEICKNIRDQNIKIPVLMLTAKDTVGNKLEGFNSGADDYLTKPFAFDELLVRMQAILRRPKQILPVEIIHGNLMLSSVDRRVYYKNKEFFLTLKEFNLLEYFLSHPNQVLTREQILDKLWDSSFDSFSNVIDVHIKNLRKKLADLSHEEILETIRGVGYRLKS